MTNPAPALHPALAKYRRAASADHVYPDLHAHIETLARLGLLVVVDEPINKEVHPLVRWQFRGGIAEADRRAFLFIQPTDAQGTRYDGAVLIAGLSGSRDVYAAGFGQPVEQIGATWLRALANPLAPRIVEHAVCQDIVITGADLDTPGNGLDGPPCRSRRRGGTTGCI